MYIESSAVLSWLLSEPRSGRVREALSAAESVLTSELTLVECDRALVRGTATGLLTEGMAAERRGTLAAAAEHWNLLALGREVLERARRPFPREPLRTLDAIHVASALLARSWVPGIRVLSLDDRIRACARELGLEILPG